MTCGRELAIQPSLMSPYANLMLTFAVCAVVVGVMISLNRILGPRPGRGSAVKGETFECGNPPTGQAWSRFAVKFYMVAILFIVFDVEVVFMYPWAVLYRDLGLFGFVEMTTFVAVLGVGFFYVWRKGALDWR